MKTKRFSISRFKADESGELPIELIVLSASVLLLGATYFETQRSDVDAGISSASEEVFVRKCGHIRTVDSAQEVANAPTTSCN